MFPINFWRKNPCRAAILIPFLATSTWAGTHSSIDQLLEDLTGATARGDTVSVTRWIQTCPDRVYLATIRLAEKALKKTYRGEREGAEDLRAARVIADTYGLHTGNRALADLVALYSSYDAGQIAQHILADSLYREGRSLCERGEYDAALDLFFRAKADHKKLGDPKAEGLDLIEIGMTLIQMGELNQARAHLARAAQLESDIGYAAGLGAVLFVLGWLDLREGDFRQAIQTFRQTRQIGLALGRDDYVAAALGNLAAAYYQCGRYHEAVAMCREAIATYRRLGDQPLHLATTLRNMALVHSTRLAEFDEATRALEECISIAAREGFTAQEGAALCSLAEVEFARGREQSALQTISRGISLLESSDDVAYLPRAFEARGRFLRELGKLEQAKQDLERALQLARKQASPLPLWGALAWLALTEADLGDHEGALEHGYEAIRIFEATRGRVGVEELMASAPHQLMHVYEAAIRPLWDLDQVFPAEGHRAQAFRLLEQCKSRIALDFLGKRAVVEGTEIGRTRQGLVERLSSLQLDLLTRHAGVAQRDSISREIRVVRAQLDSLEMATASRDLGFSRRGILGPDSIMHELHWPGEVLLEFYWGWERVYAWALAGDEIRFFAVGSSEDLEALVGVFGSLLRDRERVPFDSPVPLKLAEYLLGPVADWIPQVERLVVAPDGPLFTIPFEALPYRQSGEDASRETSKEREFLIERCEVCYAPSASLWRHLSNLPSSRPRASHDLIAFGDPVVAPDTLRQRWFPLAYAGMELRELARIFSPGETTILSGAEASEDRAKSGTMRDYRALHFATHAYASTLDPSASGLLLTCGDENDGFLTSLEILGLDLAADLVTLSGCESARGRLVSGEGILGLSRAFFYAGTASVLASLWEVDDEHTARFMGRFYRHLAQGMNKGQALAATKRECLAGNKNLSPHPYYWAPFVLMGDADGILSLTARAWYERPIVWPLLGLAIACVLALGRIAGRRRPRDIRQSGDITEWH